MSRTRIVKGKITEIVGKDYNIFSASNIVDNAAEVISDKGEKKGESYGNPKPAPILSGKIDALCIVEFRPRLPNYGKFGFDFPRVGDNSVSGVHDMTYIGNMGTHAQNKYSGAFTADAAPYNKFKAIVTGEFNPLVIATAEFIKANIRERYATPWLSLYRVPEGRLLVDGTTADPEAETCIAATLTLLIEVKTEPDELRLEFDDTLFTISGGGGAVTKAEPLKPKSSYFSIPQKSATVGSSGTPHTMEIEINCIKDISAIASIKAFSITKDPTTNVVTELLAGKLLIKPNNKANRKTKKIVLVNVLRSLAPSGGNVTGQEDNLKHTLRQALIDPRTKTDELDLIIDTSFNTYLHTLPLTAGSAPGTPASKVIKGYYVYDYANRRENTHKPRVWKNLWKYLNEKLISKKGNKYNNYIKVYYFGSEGGNINAGGSFEGLAGYSQPGENTTVLFKRYDLIATTAHEVLHSMGLDHTFENKNIIPTGMTKTNAPNGKYTFQFATTDNILDYSNQNWIDRKSLMEWQWEIIRAISQPEP